jgi:prevent-host-death family protein
MTSVGIRELKARLSAYIRKAREGQTVYVTDHGRIVAELRPPRSRGASSRAARRWEQALATEAVIPAERPGDKSWLSARSAGLPRGTAAALLDAERDER